VHTITEEGRAILEKLQLLTNKDVLIIYSFLAIPREYQIAIELASEAGCPVILFTDTVAKEMVNGVSLVLAARRGPATIYHTDIVPMAIQTALILQIAKKRPSEVLKHLERLQELRRRFGFA
jgi:DNA-binding MurR/RpiR family transcriptional regulator